MIAKGYIDKKGRGKAMNAWLVKSDYEIVQESNWVTRGLVSYYAQGVERYNEVDKWRWRLDVSCKKTLGKKHKMSSIKVMKKYGDPVIATTGRGKGKKTIRQVDRETCKALHENLRKEANKEGREYVPVTTMFSIGEQE